MNRPKLDLTNTQIAFASKSTSELKKTAFLFTMMSKPLLVKLFSNITVQAIKWNIPGVSYIVEKTIFEHFCGGISLADCQTKVDKLYQHDCLTVLDFGAEAKDREEDFDITLQEIMRAIDFAAVNNSIPVVSTKITGLARFSLMEKFQAGAELSNEEQKELKRFIDRTDKLCAHAEKRSVGVMVDAEETWIQDVVDDLVRKMMAKYNRHKVIVYNTYQMYRKGKLEDLKQAHEEALLENYLLGAKLVRGAYMEKERARAKELNYPSPINETKVDTDKNYNQALKYCVDNYESIGSCNATHNVESCELLAQWIDEKGILKNHPHLNFCQLYGMSDIISFNLAGAGYNVAKYVPYGPIRDIVPYLIRRAQENTSVTGEVGRELKLVKEELKRRSSS